MQIIDTDLPGVLIIEPKVFVISADSSWKPGTRPPMQHRNIRCIRADNLSLSKKGTLRGLHFQKPTHRANWSMRFRAKCLT